MKRVPLIATLIVALCIAAMIALGVWQLDRLNEKEAMLARYDANARSPVMTFPSRTDDTLLFRRASVMCLEPVAWQVTGAGAAGFRHIAECRTGAEGLSIPVDVGSSPDPAAKSIWRGGEVTGTITYAPDASSALGRWLGSAPPRRLMLVAETAAPGLTPSARPDPASVPNNHLAYAVQWFLFASVAAIIYALALLRRWRNRDRAAAPAQ